MDVYIVETICSFFISGTKRYLWAPRWFVLVFECIVMLWLNWYNCSLFDHCKSISGNIILNNDDWHLTMSHVHSDIKNKRMIDINQSVGVWQTEVLVRHGMPFRNTNIIRVCASGSLLENMTHGLTIGAAVDQPWYIRSLDMSMTVNNLKSIYPIQSHVRANLVNVR